MTRFIIVGTLLALTQAAAQGASADFVGADAPQPLPAPLADSLARIDADVLRAEIAWLADPARQGRGLGSPGLAATAAHLAAELHAAGIRPLGGGTYFQGVPLREVRSPGGDLEIRVPGAGRQTSRAGDGCVLPEILPQTLSGRVVFAGWGIREPTLGRDDFHGIDVRDKIVVFKSGVPPGDEWQRPELIDRYAFPRPQDRYDPRLALLEQLGARAAIAIEDDLAARLRASQEPIEPFFLAAEEAASPAGEPPLVRVTPQVAKLLTLGGNAAAKIRVTGSVQMVSSPNVVGVLEGSDPQLRRQAVIVGAHMDAFGMRGGVLHPAADDNASGVSALLEIAKAFAASPVRPRRTLLFIFWTAEEAGQLGSSYYVSHPLWPLEQTAAYLNLDMIAHPWAAEEIRTLAMAADPGAAAPLLARATPANFAEPGLAEWAPWLRDALGAAARGTGMVLHLDRGTGTDGGSDYRSFARHHRPWVRFFGNFFPGYHEPEDTPDKLDPRQVQRMARLAFATAWLLADAGAEQP